MSPRKRCTRLVRWSLALLLTCPAWVGAEGASEASLKAAYLYNFAKFVTAPAWSAESPGSPFRICILGQHPFGDALQTLADKQVRHHRVEVDFMRTAGPVAHCHVLFISTSEAPRVRRLLQALSTNPVLTVSDMGGFAANGGMIELLRQDRRLRFEINLDAAREGGLSFSPKLIRLAVGIIGARVER